MISHPGLEPPVVQPIGKPKGIDSMKKTLKAVFATLSALSLAITALVSVPAANAAGATSINAQPVSKLKQGGTLTLPILYPPIQYNISHPDGNDAAVS